MNQEKLRVSVFSFDLPSQACAQLRLLQPLFALRDQVAFTWEVKNNGQKYMLGADPAKDADLAILQRGFPCAETAPIIDALLERGLPVIYEIDDDLLHMPAGHPLKANSDAQLDQVRRVAGRAALITVSTPALALAFAGLNERVRVLPNLLMDGVFAGEPRPVRGPTVVLYAGTATHEEDLALLEGPVRRMIEKHGPAVVFKFYGCAPPGLDEGPSVQLVPFDPDYLSYVRRLPRLGGHVALAPLADNPFNRAKSNIKWLEYSACGLAGIYADLPPYAQSVDPGRTGHLAPADPRAWFELLDELVSRPESRLDMAARAREAALSGYGLAGRAGEFLACWREAAGRAD